MTLSIQKRVGANIVQVADSVKAVVAKAQERLPGAVKFDVTFDMSKDIRNQVADLENNMACRPGAGRRRPAAVHGLADQPDRGPDHPASAC